jgi:hypothetical protein
LTCSIFKSNVVQAIRRLGKGFTKKDHIIVVVGPGKSLERNYHHSIENDLNFIAYRTSNTDAGFVNLFEGHNNPMDEWEGEEHESTA